MTVSDPNVSRVLSINQRTRKIPQNRIIPAHTPHDVDISHFIKECGCNFRGEGEGGQVVVFCGKGGGGVHTNSFAEKKTKKKNNVRAFFQSVGLGLHTAKPDENFLDPRMDIHVRYRGGRETISLLKNLL